MKKVGFIAFLGTITIFLIMFACTKEVNLITNVELEFNQGIGSREGFVNDELPSIMIITPEAFLPEFEYFFSYEILEGQGVFLNNDATELPPNENIQLTKTEEETNFILNLNYKGLSAGNHRVKVIASDNFDKKIETVLSYTILNIPVVWTVTTPTNELLLGDTTIATIELQNNTEAAVTLENSYTFTDGSGELRDENNTSIQLDQMNSITPGIYQITIEPTQLGTNTINFNLEDSNGQQLVATITLTVVTEDTNIEPKANITASPTIGTAPLEVQFTANASDPNSEDILTFAWDFGDGNTSTEENPLHQFITSKETPYTVVLIVSDNSESFTDTTNITVNEFVSGTNSPPMVKITATPTSGSAPLSVQFNTTVKDQDPGDSFEYNWDFGDETTSTEANPIHQYTAASTTPYTATVIVSDGTDSVTKTIAITVNPTPNKPPIANASQSSPTFGDIPLTVNFSSEGSSDDKGITSYNWDFEDGTTSTEANPTHTFITAGEYMVKLTVEDLEKATRDTIVTITANNPPLPYKEHGLRLVGQNLTEVANFCNVVPTTERKKINIRIPDKLVEGTIHRITIDSRTSYYYVDTSSDDPQSDADENIESTAVMEKVDPCQLRPTAVIQTSPSTMDGAPDTVNFTAANSTTPTGSTITSYSWNFGDPSSGANNTFTSTSPTASHEYQTANTYTVELTVENSFGVTDTATTTVVIAPVLEPDFDFVISTVQQEQSKIEFTITPNAASAGIIYRMTFRQTGQRASLLNTFSYNDFPQSQNTSFIVPSGTSSGEYQPNDGNTGSSYPIELEFTVTPSIGDPIIRTTTLLLCGVTVNCP